MTAGAPTIRRRLGSPRKPPVVLVLLLCGVVALGVMVDAVRAQNSTNSTRPTPATHPPEARALNTLFSRWQIPSIAYVWNINGEFCSGTAVDASPVGNPGIKCDCSYSGNTTCHITALKVNGLNVWGQLQEELWNLPYLTYLDLEHNRFTGPIPVYIRNLVHLQYLNLGRNALSGELPGELGLLLDLTYLSFRINYFSGHLPAELGNLSRLKEIYLDSSGVSGPIPSTFSNLRNMERIWGSDNELTGMIPSFIGNWSNLISMRFQGNSFQGPIPSSFNSLTALNDLRVSDLLNGSSSLDFLRNMNSLITVILRNNNVFGAIPSFFSEFENLSLLDLSFNNLIGTVPNLLFSDLGSLSHVFLGNNMLTGWLPYQKGSHLQNILSFNELSGIFPPWVTEQPLQLNLVGNHFTQDSSDQSGLPFGLGCLQRNFTCNRGAPIYSSFAINCGGPQIRSTGEVVYERDDNILGPATYYVSSTGNWAVSNAGFPSDRSTPLYKISSSTRYTNELDSALFQTARISAGSLRYYGLRLENGNYSVRLEFAEMELGRSGSGRRIFDIYIQGNLVVKDFDILREAKDMPLSAVVRYTAQVRYNYLEIHLFWAGKGTCYSPVAICGPTISTIWATSDFIPSKPPSKRWSGTRLFVVIVVAVAVPTICLFSIAALYYVCKKRKGKENFEDEGLMGINARPFTYTYAELKAATDDFNLANKLGEGGFGPVYKGTLGDGTQVAIKQLSVASHHGKSQFVAEIATISAVQHRNLVKLYGCCIEGDKRLLVYEYHENKSLDHLLFGIGNKCLCIGFTKRYDICLGVARGLAYLHEESRLRIVHRDVKASNILLDSNFTPKISDFGLAKLYDDKKTHISTKVAGTRGYLAPEYAMLGHLTEKADIFSFGVVALEMISGRPNSVSDVEEDKIYLLEWAWNLHENNRGIELADPTLSQFDENLVKKMINIGLLCTQASPGLRPSMSRVVGMLTGDIEVPSVTSKPGYLTDWRFVDETFMNEIGSSNPNAADGIYTDMSAGTTMLTDPDIPLIDDGR